MLRIESWCGYEIRFVEIRGGEWYAVLKDICDALGLKTFDVSQRLDPSMVERVRINVCDTGLNRVRSRARHTQDMLMVNEIGIYEALFASRKLEARKFRRWTASVMQKLRSRVGLEGYEVMRMTDSDIQEKIYELLDTIFYDEETGKVMRSITVQGGDVEQVLFE